MEVSINFIKGNLLINLQITSSMEALAMWVSFRGLMVMKIVKGMEASHLTVDKVVKDNSLTTERMVVAMPDLIIEIMGIFLELLEVILRMVHHRVLGVIILARNHTSYLSVGFAAKRGIRLQIVFTEMINHLYLVEQFISARSVENRGTLF